MISEKGSSLRTLGSKLKERISIGDTKYRIYLGSHASSVVEKGSFLRVVLDGKGKSTDDTRSRIWSLIISS